MLFFLPAALPPLPSRPAAFSESELLITEVMSESSVVSQYCTFNGRMWIRISGSVYATREDMIRLKEAVVKRMEANGWVKGRK